jgi:hypothetical protein
MTPVQLLAILAAVVLLATVLELVRRHRLTEEYSLIWICCAVVVLVFAVQRRWLDAVAIRLGIYYPPALLLLGLGAFVLLIALGFSVALSRQRRQIEHLAEEIALLDAQLRAADGASPRGTVPSGEMIPGAAHERQQPRN